jgi:putative transcriptional regulator
MDDARFEDLLTSVDEMKSHMQGDDTEMRVSFVDEPDPRAIRDQMGLSQKDFAYVLGVSVKTLQNWEQGRRDPNGAAMKLLRIAEQRPKILLELV